MKLDNIQYEELYTKHSEPSNVVKNTFIAFIVGGLICVIGEVIRQRYIAMGWDKEAVSTALSVTMIFLGILLTVLRVYRKIAKFAGAGTIVPITGFANAVSSPAIEFKSEGIIFGTCVKMFTIAGPVLVFGVTASILYGLIFYFIK